MTPTTNHNLLAQTLLWAALLAFAVWGITWLAPRLAAGFDNHVQQATKTPRKVSL